MALTDYNATHKAGASLNQIARINGKQLQAFIDYQNQYQYSHHNSSFEIRLTERADATVKQAFKLEFKLTNGEFYTTETLPVKIY